MAHIFAKHGSIAGWVIAFCGCALSGEILAVEAAFEGQVEAQQVPLDLELYGAATAPLPPGLTVSRRTERQSEREAARMLLLEQIEGVGGAAWQRYLEERLRYGQDRPVAWGAAAELVVAFERFDLSHALVTGLAAPEDGLVFQAAHGALASLYGRRFADLTDFENFTQGLELTPATLRLIAELRLERQNSQARLLQIFGFDHGVAIAHIGDVDMAIRLGAAGALEVALRDGRADADQVFPVLVERFGLERSPEVAEALLDAVSAALEGRPGDDLLVAESRSVLSNSARGFGSELLVARALARLPWLAKEPGATSSLESGAGLMALLLRRATPDNGAGRVGGDADVILGILRALDSLCVAAGSDVESAQRLANTEVHTPLLGLAFADHADTGARVVAVGILPRVMGPSGVLDLIRLLSRTPGDGVELPVSLRFAAMGAMGRFGERGELGERELPQLAACLKRHVSRPEADLRRRALELLGTDALTSELSGRNMQEFVLRLGVEDEPDLQAELLRLIGRHGGAQDLTGILALANFDQLAAEDAAGDASLAGLIEKLTVGDSQSSFEAALRLWEVDLGAGLWARRGAALGLVARLSSEHAAELSADQHRVVADWAGELRAAGVSLGVTMPGGVDFLHRLIDLHLAKSGSVEAHWLAEQNLSSALFNSDLARALGNGEAERLRGEVLAKFALAEELAADHPTSGFLYRVRLSRARFLVSTPTAADGASNTTPVALVDYRFVFDSDFQTELGAADLRSAAELARALVTPLDLRSAMDFNLALVALDGWGVEPVAVRLGDLDRLVDCAKALGSEVELERARLLFAGLPEVFAEGDEVEVPAGAAWAGLVGTELGLGEVQGLLAGLGVAVSKPVPAPEDSGIVSGDGEEVKDSMGGG